MVFFGGGERGVEAGGQPARQGGQDTYDFTVGYYEAAPSALRGNLLLQVGGVSGEGEVFD
jgi:hypothetical protein